MNKAILIGNLASDPESRTTASGISQCSFRLAVQRPFSNQQGVRETDFLTIVCWRQNADFCSRYLSKGNRIAVEGSIQTRSYDAQDGSKRYVTEIIADRVESLTSRAESAQASQGNYSAPAPAPAPRAAAPAASNSFTEIDDDELPF